jgi:hypothetical protein
LATQSSAAAGGVEGEAVGDGDTVAEVDGLGETEVEGEGETHATTIFLEHTLAGSTSNTGAVTGLATATAVGFGVGRVVTLAGFRTK